jgi:hypothetical protein
MKGYPKILLKTKADELYGLGYPAILLKADEIFDLSYDVIENIHGRDARVISGIRRKPPPRRGNGHDGWNQRKNGKNGRTKPLNNVESMS